MRATYSVKRVGAVVVVVVVGGCSVLFLFLAVFIASFFRVTSQPSAVPQWCMSWTRYDTLSGRMVSRSLRTSPCWCARDGARNDHARSHVRSGLLSRAVSDLRWFVELGIVLVFGCCVTSLKFV